MQNVKDAAHAIAEKVKGVTTGALYEGNKTETQSSSEQKSHEAKKDATEERGVIGHIGDTISNAYHFVAEKVHEATNVVSFESNKDKAKDSANKVGEQASNNHSGVGDKLEDKAHHANIEGHKE